MEGGRPEGALMEGQWGHVEEVGAGVEERQQPLPLHHRTRNLLAQQVAPEVAAVGSTTLSCHAGTTHLDLPLLVEYT